MSSLPTKSVTVQYLDAESLIESITSSLMTALRPAIEKSHSPLLVDGDGMARLAGVSAPTIDRLRKRGEIPSVLIGRCRRYEPLAVIEAITNEKGGSDHE